MATWQDQSLLARCVCSDGGLGHLFSINAFCLHHSAINLLHETMCNFTMKKVWFSTPRHSKSNFQISSTTNLWGKEDALQATALCSAEKSGSLNFYIAGYRAKSQQPVLLRSLVEGLENESWNKQHGSSSRKAHGKNIWQWYEMRRRFHVPEHDILTFTDEHWGCDKSALCSSFLVTRAMASYVHEHCVPARSLLGTYQAHRNNSHVRSMESQEISFPSQLWHCAFPSE